MKILWGFEPRSQNRKAVRGMHDVLRQFAGSANKISVGYVVTENELYLHTAYDVPKEERFSSHPKRLILKELRDAGVSMPPRNVQVIHHPSFTNTKAAYRFLAIGKNEGAEIVALFTKGKRGVERLVLGSFAETTLHLSRLDVLLMGPQAQSRKRIKRILYASDFGPDTKRSVRQVLRYCKMMRANLTVFHSPRTIYKWAIDEKDSDVLAYRRKVDRVAQEVAQLAQRGGIDCSVVVQTDFRSPSEHALDLAKEIKADLLAVRAKSGPTAPFMGGSVTRHLVRNGTYPVLVLK